MADICEVDTYFDKKQNQCYACARGCNLAKFFTTSTFEPTDECYTQCAGFLFAQQNIHFNEKLAEMQKLFTSHLQEIRKAQSTLDPISIAALIISLVVLFLVVILIFVLCKKQSFKARSIKGGIFPDTGSYGDEHLTASGAPGLSMDDENYSKNDAPFLQQELREIVPKIPRVIPSSSGVTYSGLPNSASVHNPTTDTYRMAIESVFPGNVTVDPAMNAHDPLSSLIKTNDSDKYSNTGSNNPYFNACHRKDSITSLSDWQTSSPQTSNLYEDSCPTFYLTQDVENKIANTDYMISRMSTQEGIVFVVRHGNLELAQEEIGTFLIQKCPKIPFVIRESAFRED